MKRLVLLAVLASCTDSSTRITVDDGSEPATKAERLFVHDVMPMLQANCAACHGGSDPQVAFLAGSTWQQIRTSLLTSAVVDVIEPTQSRLLSKGAHSGPSMTALQTVSIIQWLEAERDEL